MSKSKDQTKSSLPALQPITSIEVLSKRGSNKVFIVINSTVAEHGLEMSIEQASDLQATLGRAIQALTWGGN